jgi:hypothetical protein
MSDLEKAKPFRAYWFDLHPTGVEAIDAILREIAAAGKGSHSTEFWGGQGNLYEGEINYVERIQQAANDAARKWANLTSPETREAIAKAIWSKIYFLSDETEWNDLLPSTKELYFSAAEVVLRSVEEGTE